MSESLSSLPTVRPADFAWLAAAQPLLQLPAGTALVCHSPTLPSPATLERWVAFFCAAVAFEARWGQRHGAVRLTTIELDGRRVEVLAAFGRVAFLVGEGHFTALPTARELERQLANGMRSGARYSIEWAAAAYALSVLEAA